MEYFLAQRPVSWDRPYDVADGFALTLILMLFLVLGGVALVARGFRRRERDRSRQPWQDLSQEDGQEPAKPPGFPLNRRTGKPPEAPWERDADWWKGPPEGEEGR